MTHRFSSLEEECEVLHRLSSFLYGWPGMSARQWRETGRAMLDAIGLHVVVLKDERELNENKNRK